jgi:hypothetical protein
MKSAPYLDRKLQNDRNYRSGGSQSEFRLTKFILILSPAPQRPNLTTDNNSASVKIASPPYLHALFQPSPHSNVTHRCMAMGGALIQLPYRLPILKEGDVD